MGFPFRPALLLLLTLSGGLLHGEGLEKLIGQFQAKRDGLPADILPWKRIDPQRQDDLAAAWEKRLESLGYASLDAASRIDWHLLATEVAEFRASSRLSRTQAREIDPILVFSQPIQGLITIRDRRQPLDAAKAAASLQAAITALTEIRKRLEEPATAGGIRPSPITALLAADATDRIRAELKSWYRFYNGFHADFAAWAKVPYQDLTADLSALAAALRKDIPGIANGQDAALTGYPIGAEAIRIALRKEMIPYTAEELIAIAGTEFSWCETEMKKAVADLGCASTAAALEKIREDHPSPGERKAAVIMEAGKAIRFLKEKELVSIPALAEKTWRVAMAAPEMLKTLPYVSYREPRLMIPYASDAMPADERALSLRANNAAFLHILTPHELIPGHHLQMFMAGRHATYRSAFSTPFLLEGWAIHWEMLLWDQGYLTTPGERVGALFWRMHRCARVIVTLRFHLGEMTPPQMVAFLTDRVGHEKDAATAEVRRYIGGSYSPLYQAGYMVGGLQLHALQKELTGPGPGNEGARGKLTLREFHDRILQLGPIPIELIRASLKEQMLPKDWTPAWRFSG